MNRESMIKSLRLLTIVAFAISLMVGCIDMDLESEEIEDESHQQMISRGIITASLNRYVETGYDEPFEQFGLMGMFINHDIDETVGVDGLLRDPETEMIIDKDGSPIALDMCTIPAQSLEMGLPNLAGKESSIELLDVGDLAVSFGDEKKPIPARTFPDLLEVIVGVLYTADETQGFTYSPGQTYNLKGSGTEEVGAFEVALDAPTDLSSIKIDQMSPGDRPFVHRGGDIEISWESDGYGDEVIASFNWTSLGSPWSMTCRMRDDGHFVVPASMTSKIPDPLTCSDEELTISRIRQVAFRADGLSEGSFQFVVSTNFPIKF